MTIPKSLMQGRSPAILEDIFAICCRYNNVEVKKAKSKKRKRECVTARQMYMALIKEMTPLTLSEIGKSAGLCKDHATVLHSKRTVKNLCETDTAYRMNYRRIKEAAVNLIREKGGEITDYESVEGVLSSNSIAQISFLSDLIRDDILMEGWRKEKALDTINTLKQNILILNK